jgi:hypothetical protein
MNSNCDKFGFKNEMTPRDRKKVYRKQLLKHHPDKNDGKITPLWDELKDCYYYQRMGYDETYLDLLNKNQKQYTNCKAIIEFFKTTLDSKKALVGIGNEDMHFYKVKKVQCGGATENTFKLRITIRIEPGRKNRSKPPNMKTEIDYIKEYFLEGWPVNVKHPLVPIKKVLQGPKGPITLKNLYIGISAVTVV